MLENPTTALVKTNQSPALARVSNQLALTDKLLAKPEEPFLIPYRKGNKWGYCDRSKNIVIDCVYDEVWPFNEGLSSVKLNNKYAIINQSGVLNSQFEFDWIYPYAESLFSTKKDERWGYTNKIGETKIAYMFEWAYPFENGKAKVKYRNLWCLIDKNGNFLNESYINTGFDLYYNGFSRVEYEKKWGYLSLKNTLRIKYKYDWASRFYNGLAQIKLNEKNGFIDTNGSEFWQS